MWVPIILSLLAALSQGFLIEQEIRDYPTYPSKQHVKGYVSLPYAELYEPFEFWLTDDDKGASRLDWYNGLDTVLDRPDIGGSYGTQFAFNYATLPDNDDAFTCFITNGTSDSPITSDAVLPDLTNFTYQGPTTLRGQDVYLLLKQQNVGDKENTYKFYYTKDDKTYTPVQYSFLGYDTLLGSHYDRYDIYYTLFEDTIKDDSVFDLYEQYSCIYYPGPGNAEAQIEKKPLHDLLKPDSSRYDEAFNDFKRVHNKNYQTEKEHRQRRANYVQNLRHIHMKNRAGLSYKLKVNHLADTTRGERKAQLGLRRIQDGRVPDAILYDAEAARKERKGNSSLPEFWDWRIAGAVTAVKDQAICGSCWSFGTTGTLEGAYFLKHGRIVRLSQQNLMDCSWKEGNNGCNGGEDWRAYTYIRDESGGLMTEDDYGHYLGQDGKCHFNISKSVLDIENYAFVVGESEDTVKRALINHGPLSIGIDASLNSFSFYSHGLYNDPECGNKLDDLDHSVLLVGYGQFPSGAEYWLVKNSWSTYWGNLGYVTFAIAGNVCGVMTQPTFANLV